MKMKLLMWMMTLLMLVMSVSAGSLTDDTIAYWNMSGTEDVVDDTGNGWTLTEVGTVPVSTGILGQARGQYTDNTDYFYHPTFLDSGLSEWTVSTWFKLSQIDVGQQQSIFSKTVAGGTYYFECFVKANTQIVQCLIDDGGAGITNIESNTTASLGEYHHLIFTGSSTGDATIYLDGVSVANTTNTHEVHSNTGQEFTIGERGHLSFGYGNWKGWLDEFAVLNRSVTPDEAFFMYDTQDWFTQTNFTITANTDFVALVDGQTYNSTGQEIVTHLTKNATQLYTIILSPDNFLLNKTFVDYNVSQNLAYNFTLLNVSAINIQTNVSLENFSLNIYQPTQGYNKTLSTTNGYIDTYLVGGLTYVTLIDSTGFALQTHTFTNLTNDTSYQFALYEANSMLINVYAQATGALLENVLVSLSLSSTPQTQTNTTYNGTLFITDLTAATYLVEASVTGFVDQSQSVIVSNSTFEVVNFYMVEQSSASEIPFSGLSKETCSHGSAGVLFLIFSILLPFGFIVYGFKLRQPLLGIIGSILAMLMASYTAACFDILGQMMLLIGIVFFLVHTFSIITHKR